MKKSGGTSCTSKRGTLRKYRRQLTTIYNISAKKEVKDFISGELSSINEMLKNFNFCPTKEFIIAYKTTTDATISELSK
jgi:hypothetical protein